jgi:hypothetical protein
VIRIPANYPVLNLTARERQIQCRIDDFMDIDMAVDAGVLASNMRQTKPWSTVDQVLRVLRVMEECGLIEQVDVIETRLLMGGKTMEVRSRAWRIRENRE